MRIEYLPALRFPTLILAAALYHSLGISSACNGLTYATMATVCMNQGDELNVAEANAINEQEMMQYIADKTKASQANIALVLKHEQAYINKAHENAKGNDVDIDGDDLADYILSRKDVKLDELTVESILDAEMDYLMDKGHAGYVD